MGYALSMTALIRLATRTHAAASRHAQPRRFLGGWRDRRFVSGIDEFVHALHHVPPSEAARVTPEQALQIHELIDQIIDDVERFLSARRASTGKELERHQRLAACVYDLRQAFESISRRLTPNPHVMDLKREISVKDANLPKR